MEIPKILLNKANEVEAKLKEKCPEAAPFFKGCFLNTIETTLLSSQFETVILDFSQDVIKCRSLILNSIKKNKILCKKINFIAISLRPGYKNIILWSQKRLNKNLTHKEKINIKKVYYDFEYPTIEEFAQYNFNSILIISLDNSKYKIYNEKEGN